MTTDGLCECGCGEKTTIADRTRPEHGTVAGEPQRFRKGHQARKSPVDFIEDPDTNCWVWQFTRHFSGYGLAKRDGRTRRAHRVFYEEMVGPIPEGLTLDHLCCNRPCVNPGHLEPVTNAENNRRARKETCQRGHPFDPEDSFQGRRYCRECRRAAERRRYWEGKAA